MRRRRVSRRSHPKETDFNPSTEKLPMTTYLGVLSISLLLLAVAVRESVATPLTVVGLMGLVVLRMYAASGGWSLRRSIVRAGGRGTSRGSTSTVSRTRSVTTGELSPRPH